MTLATRLDSWMNAAMGFGGITDKLRQTRFNGYVRHIPDNELTAMYRAEHFSSKIVDVYPREALREGFEIGGYAEGDEHDDDTEELACAYLRRWQLNAEVLSAAIWGRLYGGACVWKGSFTSDPAAPFVMGEQIDFLRVVDRRYLQPIPYTLDARGRPTQYDVIPEEGGPRVGPVHVSRLVMFPGARTDSLTKRGHDWWDDSVLQRAYDALKSDGTVWYAVEQLVTEVSLGILRVKNLYATQANAKAREGLLQRLAFFAQTKSIAKNITLDYDDEDYKRDTISFAGLPDLTMAGVKRVASAAEIPVSVLLSDEPSGLNATGDASIRWWLMRVHAYRVGDLEVPVLNLARSLLAQSGIPGITPESVEGLTVKWPNLWTPSAAEQAEIRSKTSAADKSDIDAGILTAEEVAKSRYGEDGYSQETHIDHDLREGPSDEDLARAGEEGAAQGMGATGPTGAAAPASLSGGDLAGAPAGENVQQQVFNGTQTTSLLEAIKLVASGDIPRDSGIQALVVCFQMTEEAATKVMASAGTPAFKPPAPEPSPFGGGGGAPPGAPKPPGTKAEAKPNPEATEKPPAKE